MTLPVPVVLIGVDPAQVIGEIAVAGDVVVLNLGVGVSSAAGT